MVDPDGRPGRAARHDRRRRCRGWTGDYAVAAADAPGLDGRRYTVLVAVPTRVETTALGRSTEFALIGAVGLVALLGAVTTFAIGQALRPVERMRDQVESIAGSRPAPVLEVPPGRDELAKLAETLNRVLERLRRGRRLAARLRRGCRARAAQPARHDPRAARPARRGPPARGPARWWPSRASAEVDRLAMLVDDLLILAAADEHAVPITTVEVDLDDVVLGEAGLLRARGMPVTVRVEPARVRGDAARLGRVVRNLLENAERHRVRRCPGAAHPRRRHGAARRRQRRPAGRGGGPGPHLRPVRAPRRLPHPRHRGHRARAWPSSPRSSRRTAAPSTAGTTPEGWCRFSVRIPLDSQSG